MDTKDLARLYTVDVDGVTNAEWSSLMQRFDDSTIYQTWSYGAVRWGEHNLSHIVLKEGGEVVAMAQAALWTLPILRIGIAYVANGPMWRLRGKREEVDRLQQITRALRKEYSVRRGLFLRLVPNELEENSSTIRSIFEGEGFQWKPYVYRTILLDLTPSLGDLRKGLSKHWRRHLNRAEKNNLEIIEGNSDKLYHTFLHLIKELVIRKKFVPGVNYEEFREIQTDLPDPLKMKIMICQYEGEPASVTINSAIGNTGIYLFGATSNKGLKLSGSYLLFWRTIEWLKEHGCRCFDLCGVDPERNPGVYFFKSGVGGKEVCHIGQFDTCASALNSILVACGDEVRLTWRKMRVDLNRMKNSLHDAFKLRRAGGEKNGKSTVC